MTINDFIFSNQPLPRYSRHIAFWLGRLCYWTFQLGIKVQISLTGLHSPGAIRNQVLGPALLCLIPEIIITYSLVYWLYPVYLKKGQYRTFTGLTLLLLALVFIATFPRTEISHGDFQPLGFFFQIWYRFLYFTGSTLTGSILFIVIKIYKTHYIRLEERQALIDGTADAEFRLLKAQVHPHFLFNTLNNMYSFALHGSPQAGELVNGLSRLLRYMIQDCEAARMPLDRELKMLQDYIGLEKVRYGDRLRIQLAIHGDIQSWQVPPLLMIPFLENCFKHGASQVLEHPWVSMKITVTGDHLDFRLSNSRPVSGNQGNGKSGIGLKNIRKRLELLYKDRYKLQLDPAPGTYSVYMIIPLEPITAPAAQAHTGKSLTV